MAAIDKKHQCDRPRFLETITILEDDILVPIEDIKFISVRYNNGSWVIKIQGKNDSFQFEEYFQLDTARLAKRYKQIKSIIGAK